MSGGISDINARRTKCMPSTIVQMYSRYSPEDVDKMFNALLDAVDDFMSELVDNMSDFDIELKAHDT